MIAFIVLRVDARDRRIDATQGNPVACGHACR